MCKERYINPFTDFGFKKLFGTAANKCFLISFLNSLFEEEDKIVDITYRNVEQLGMRPDNRNAIFDLYCTTESKGHIIVEMQNGYQPNFIDRSIYYSTFPMHEEAKKSDWVFQFPKIFIVAFLNSVLKVHRLGDGYKHVVKLVDTSSDKVYYDKLTYIYLDMPKYNKVIDDINIAGAIVSPERNADIWLYVIKYLDQFDDIPAALKGTMFEQFFHYAEVCSYPEEERWAYEMSLKAYRDYNNTLRSAEWRGEERGRAQAQGRLEAKREIARNMLKLGIEVDKIVAVTGLSVDEINQL